MDCLLSQYNLFVLLEQTATFCEVIGSDWKRTFYRRIGGKQRRVFLLKAQVAHLVKKVTEPEASVSCSLYKNLSLDNILNDLNPFHSLTSDIFVTSNPLPIWSLPMRSSN